MNWYEFKNEKPKLMINLMGKTIGQLNSWWSRLITTDPAELVELVGWRKASKWVPSCMGNLRICHSVRLVFDGFFTSFSSIIIGISSCT
ncbi:unnamed protein product [Macrosiphum euphorbiae]|uniref:Uncharacterized protein n=1 Tax=Macrosiphum euphorbiae TaxID=13131 RepID=A0AAV0VVV9_9HEMI|nr:unnamed protein product [Macrosiphum euphorbiae]